ncbi:ATP-NAD kinase-like domain-containing protein [Hyaloraphidium curvatum]|nr:ATP-NAD kinase-like domain-containing protein [Hyaloraphidium curvatum]
MPPLGTAVPSLDTVVPSAPASPTVSTESIGEHQFLPLPTRYVFIFVNPRSGPQQGRTLLDNVEVQHFRLRHFPQVQVQLYDITDETDRRAGENYLRWIWEESPVFRAAHQELHCWSAGGDGTFKSVIEVCIGLGIDITSPVVFFSAIPFGTGNDLSQVMGWGRTIPGQDVAGHRLERLNSLVIERLNGVGARLDVWEVEIEVGEGGFIKKAKWVPLADFFQGLLTSCHVIRKLPKGQQEECQTHLKTMMSNCWSTSRSPLRSSLRPADFSLGIQGMIGSFFERRRTSSRIGNVFSYMHAALHYLVRGFPHVIDTLRSIEVDGEPAVAIGRLEKEAAQKRRSSVDSLEGMPVGTPLLNQNAVELIIGNIPGLWGRQVDLWSTARTTYSAVEGAKGPTDYRTWNPNTANDQKMEIFLIRSVGEYFLKQLPWHRGNLTKVGQFPSVTKLRFREGVNTHCNIDGEFYELMNPKCITFKLLSTVTVVCPSDPMRSRLARDEEKIPGRPRGDVAPVEEDFANGVFGDAV